MIEWLVWRWDLRKLRKTCERRGHDITGPHLALGGWEVYTCTRCPYRFRADRVTYVPGPKWHSAVGLDQSSEARIPPDRTPGTPTGIAL